LVEPVTEAARVAPELLALEVQRLEELRRPLGGAVAVRRAAEAEVLGQVVTLADRLQRVAEAAGGLLRPALRPGGPAEVAVDQRAKDVLVGEELVPEARRVERGEKADGRPELAEVVPGPGLFQVQGGPARIERGQLHHVVGLERSLEVLLLVAETGHR